MNLLSIALLLVVSSAYESNHVDGDQDPGYISTGYEDDEHPQSMLRKAGGLTKVTKEESHRGDHGDLISEDEVSSFNQDHRVLTKDCNSNQQYFKIDIQTDGRSENSWKLKKRQGDSNKWAQIQSGPPNGKRYNANNRFVGGFCLSTGDYRFVILDSGEDGMCCSFGHKGKYTGYVKGSKIFSSPSNEKDWGQRAHKFSIPNRSALPLTPKIGMTTRDTEWLESHNSRRKSWHRINGKSYVPLKWSIALKDESMKFAKKLLQASCGGLYHDEDNKHGENLASNSGSGDWAQIRSADSIVARWVEDEVDYGYPGNGHLTQVLWRASKYVGCADASKAKTNGGRCRVQVCRYARPGNCNMDKSNYDTNRNDWWQIPMLMADSPCGPACPPDGCQ